MKKTKKAKFLAVLLCVIMFVCTVDVTAFAIGEKTTDATSAIKAEFSDVQIGDTQSVDDDGYIGIPLEITTYYDYETHGVAMPGYNGTIAVMYVVNTQVERIGAKTDVEIITDMLSRGYIVSVFDYKNHAKAVSPGLDFSTQTIRNDFQAGEFFTDEEKLPSGTYRDNFVVPAGYDISYGNVFWEADKHGSDGTLEKIVENWNTDFRNWNDFKNDIIYWRNSSGEQKATESDAEWFSDSTGKTAVDATAADANYTKVKYTIAEDVTDCVGPDGVTPIDLNLYMHIVYPTTSAEDPINPVPVAVLASSAEYLTTNSTALRPQYNGFLFNGYAGAIYDYLYQPMAQSDYWGYYDGRTALGALTNDRMNYGLHLYSDKKITTAAMRYLRYLSYTEGDEFVFDTDSIGVFGNSKGGWFTFLGEAELRDYTVEDTSAYTQEELELLINNRINAYTSKRQFENHNDESRYDNGITEDYTKNGVTIDGGELQPWLTYTDENGKVQEIRGYASWIYASNGSQYEDISEGHAPVFAALHLQDDFTATHNLFAEVTKNLDVPSMYVVVDLGHTFAYGPDVYDGFDTYQAMFDFANYYLKHDAVKVIHTNPTNKTGAMPTTEPITIKFSGAVPANEIEKVTLSANEKAISGIWSSVRGNMEWTFAPSEELSAATAYTLTIPASLCGDNGKEMGTDYTVSYYTESESVYDFAKVNGSEGTYFTVQVPSNASAADAKLKFYVSNDAANIAEIYTVLGFDASNPDGSTKGELVDTVNLKGEGCYSVDVTKYVLEANEGDTLTFLVQQEKTAQVKDFYNLDFATSLSDVSVGGGVSAAVSSAPDNTAAVAFKVEEIEKTYQTYYENTMNAFTSTKLFGSSALTKDDYGRQFRVSMRVYDTVSRTVQVCVDRVAGTDLHDMDAVKYNFVTKAGEWNDLVFDYTVYEMEYGNAGLMQKTFDVRIGSTGGDESPIYFDDLKVTETITDVDVESASLVLGQRGTTYKENGDGNAFSIGTNTYATLKAALSSAKSGDTIQLNKNYTVTLTDDSIGWGTLGNITLDLNGYKLYSESSLPVIHAAATTTTTANITVKNGDVYISGGALIGYSGSTAAGKGKTINVTLENLNMLNSEGAMISDFISASSIESAAGADVNVSLNGVNIDFRKSYNSKNPVKILANGSSTLNVNYVVKGGSIALDRFSRVTIYDKFKNMTFEKDSNGNYTEIYAPEGIEIPTYVVNCGEDGVATFKFASSENLVATYTVQDSELATDYGLIPEEYKDAEAYPFVMFDEAGNFLGAYSKWLGTSGAGSVMNAAKNYVVNAWDGTTYGDSPKEAFIYLRRDYTYESAENYDNLAQIQGTVNVDLGGHILSTGTQAKPLFNATAKGYSSAAGEKVFPTTINVMNGTLRHYKSGIVSVKTWDSLGDGSIANKDFNFNFTNVTFGFVDNADAVGLIAHPQSPSNQTGVAPFNFTYNDCTFDIRTTTSKWDSALLFNVATANKYAKITHTVNGGKIISDAPAKVTIINTDTDNYGSSVVFGKGSDGNYTSFVTLSTATSPTGTFKSTNGINLGFKSTEVSGNDTIYTLTEQDGTFEYGEISSTYADTTSYPFAVFDKNGTFLQGYANFGAALNAARSHLSSNVWDATNQTYGDDPYKAYVLLRRDYSTQSSTYDTTYQNMAQAQGEIVIDLNGYTITQNEDTYGIFGRVKTKGWSGSGDEAIFPSTYTIINGGFKVTSKSLFNLSTWETAGDGKIGDKLFTFNFNNVNIGYASGATATDLLFSYSAASASSGCTLSKAAPFIMNFTDCTFDMTNGPDSARLFNAAPAEGQWIQNTVTVKGGEIIANAIGDEQLFVTESVYGSSVTFVQTADGEYTTLTLSNGSAVPTVAIPNDSGSEMKFVIDSTGESTSVYKLSKK